MLRSYGGASEDLVSLPEYFEVDAATTEKGSAAPSADRSECPPVRGAKVVLEKI